MDPRLVPGSQAAVEDTAGRRLVNNVLDRHPNAAIAFINPASDLGDARELLGRSGIDIGTHAVLRGKAGAEFVVPTDAWLVGAAATDATERGQGFDLPAPHAAVEEEPVQEDDRRIASATGFAAFFVEKAA